MKRRPLLTGVALIALLLWLARREPQPGAAVAQPIEREFLALGTQVWVTLVLPADRTQVQAESALRQVETFLLDFERRWSAWGPGALGAINRALADGHAAEIPEAMRPLFDLAAQRSVDTAGRFEPRIGALVKLWGFDDEEHFRSTPPPAAEVRGALAQLRAAPALAIGARTYGPAPGVAFDFGSIGKGWALDRSIEMLRGQGFGDAIVNAGGSLRAIGRRGARPWRIGIHHPRPDEAKQMLASLETTGDEAVVTSGDYVRHFDFEGRRYHHILDPASGEPAQGLVSVTVVHRSAAAADGSTAALFVAGPQGWRDVARRLGLDQVLVVNAQGKLIATPALAARLHVPDGLTLGIAP